MAVADPRSDGGLVLKCSSCFRPVDPATGGIDPDGYALCERCDGYFAGYRDGQRDAADALTALARGALHADRVDEPLRGEED